MKDQVLLFCENRNQFFKGENEGMTFWTRKKAEAKKFTVNAAGNKITLLKSAITDAKYISAVRPDFELYN
jgi:hypothetical protein